VSGSAPSRPSHAHALELSTGAAAAAAGATGGAATAIGAAAAAAAIDGAIGSATETTAGGGTTAATGGDTPAIGGGGAGRNTAGGDGEGCDRTAAGVACDIGARAADGAPPRGRGAAGCAYAIGACAAEGCAYAIGARAVDGGTTRGRCAAGAPLGAAWPGGAPKCTAGAVLAGTGARGNGTIGICAAWLRGGGASAPIAGVAGAVGIAALGGVAVDVAGVDQGELAIGAPGQDGPSGQGAPGIGAPAAPGGPELETGRIMAIHRSSRSRTAASRRWTAASMTFSTGTPALSAIAIV
jgi:hypothetical protein